MLIFLAGVAFLLLLVIVGEQAATRVFHSGADRYFDRCAVCEKRFPRPSGIPLTMCPFGHPIAAVVVKREPFDPVAITVVALCAGFVAVAVTLTLIGVAAPP